MDTELFLEIVFFLVCLFCCGLLVKKLKKIKKLFLRSFTYYLIYTLSVMSFCGLLVVTRVLPRFVITVDSTKNESSSNDVHIEHTSNNDEQNSTEGTESIVENETEEIPFIVDAEKAKEEWYEWCRVTALEIYHSYNSLLLPLTGYSYSDNSLIEIGKGLKIIYEDTGIPYGFWENDPDYEGYLRQTANVSTFLSSSFGEELWFNTGIEEGISLQYKIADNYVDDGGYRWIQVDVDTNEGTSVPSAWEHIANGMHPEGLLLANTTPNDLHISDNMRLWIMEEEYHYTKEDESDFLIANGEFNGSSSFKIEYRLSGSGEGFAHIESFTLIFEQDSDNILRLKTIIYFIPHS